MLTSYTSVWAPWAVVFDVLLLSWAGYGWWGSRKLEFIGFAGLISSVLCADLLWIAQYGAASIAVTGTAVMAVILAGGMWVLGRALSPGWAVLGIARTIVHEAVRMKIAVGLVFGVMLLVSVLPFMLDKNERLDYRMQTYLTWALSGSVAMLSLTTVYLSCGSLCGDLTRRHVYLSLTKPVSRATYVLGKWLGIALLNVLLVSLTGGGVYVFAKVVEHQRELNEDDRLAVAEQVLVARVSVPPSPPPEDDMQRLYAEYVLQLESQNPDRVGQPLAPKTRKAIEQSILAHWYSIAPLDSKTYRFTGLSKGPQLGEGLQLRLRPQSVRPPPGGLIQLRIWLNQKPYEAVTLVDNHFHVRTLPADAVDPEGNLEVKIENVNPLNPRATFPSNVRFVPGEGVQLLYRVGSFGANLVRAMVVIWVRLVFLAALGLATATLLSFPVACLVSVMVYVTAAAKGFLSESLADFVVFPTVQASWLERFAQIISRFFQKLAAGEIGEALKIPVRGVGEAFVSLIPPFSDYNPVPLVSDGRWVAYEMITQSGLVIGLVWAGGCVLAGCLIFRRRELASVTV